MTGEPMTDAELERWERFAPPPDEAAGICRDVMSMLARIRHERSRADAAEAERDAAVARADKEADADRDFRTAIWSIIDRHGLNDVPSDELGAIARLVKLAARALPEPRLMRTVEEVEALPAGAYLICSRLNRTRAFCAALAPCAERWEVGGRLWPDRTMVGCILSGPLPDLPTPTAGETL